MQTSRLNILCLIGLLACCIGCTERPTVVEPASTYFPIAIDGKTLQLQLALDDAEQAKGLMHRDALEPNHGMLFLFKTPGPRSFWMRNTKIKLDIGYFDAAGKLLEVKKLYPYDETGVTSKSDEVLIAVETNRGWFERNEIRPDAQIDMEALKKAVKRRGKLIYSYQIKSVE